MADLDDDQKRDVRMEFGEAVNMSASQLRTWLESDESRSVGDASGTDAESTAAPVRPAPGWVAAAGESQIA